MKKVAILQSNYIPWKGYFDIIAAADEFIIYDDVQYTKNDWRNRNKIKTPNGAQWLSIPVGQNINRQVRDVFINDTTWKEKHWKTISANYSKSKYFSDVSEWLCPLYETPSQGNLSFWNRLMIESICENLNIRTKISNSWDYDITEGKTERLVSLCQQSGATHYISGPSAACYIDEDLFKNAGIRVEWFDYAGYPEYNQLWGAFVHEVTVLDLLFNCGAKSPEYMKSINC